MADGRRRLAHYLNAEMTKRGWYQRDLAREAGIGLRTVSRLILGDYGDLPPRTAARLDALFAWPTGTARDIVDEGTTPPGYGQRPIPAGAEPADRIREIIRLIRELDAGAERDDSGAQARRVLLDMLELELERRRAGEDADRGRLREPGGET